MIEKHKSTIKRSRVVSFAVGIFLLGCACCAWATTRANEPPLIADETDLPVLPKDELPARISIKKVPVGFTGLPKSPADNPTTVEKAKLGRRLFFDSVLSNDGTVSCASCHQPEHGFASPDPVAIGIGGQRGTRNAPSVLNRGFGTHFSWDGRDASLEQQAMGPLTSETEMGGDLETVLANIRKDASYVDAFSEVFGPEKSNAESVTTENIAKAIACFERTLTSGNSPVDRFRESEYEALSKSARQGLWIFESRGGCWKCHSGSNLTDEDFHNTGVGYGKENRDLGRMEATKDDNHQFRFKTPSLRDVEHTAPYMHDGSLKTLRDVVEFYNQGGNPKDALLDKTMKPLELSDEEMGFLVDFLEALSGASSAVKH
jgi:cytochrome c peroxidase